MNNYFALTVGILEVLAGLSSFLNCRYMWGWIWIFYGMATIFLFIVEGK